MTLFRVMVLALLCCLTVAARAETRVALVIGNGAYQAVGRLPNPIRDAATVAQALRETGFDSVEVLSDTGYDALRRALSVFAAKADQADWALIYYAGHGIEMGGQNFLVPVDARLRSDRDVALEAVPLDQVLASLEGARKLRLVILDACRENPFLAQMSRTGASRAIGRGLGRVEPEGGTLVAYAAKAGQVASDGDGAANSPFVTALTRHLRTPGLEINFLFRRVRDDVYTATRRQQEPFVYGSLPGENFYFRPSPETPTMGIDPGAGSAKPPAAPMVAPPAAAVAPPQAMPTRAPLPYAASELTGGPQTSRLVRLDPDGDAGRARKACGRDMFGDEACATSATFTAVNGSGEAAQKPVVTIALVENRTLARRVLKLVLPFGFLVKPGVAVQLDHERAALEGRITTCLSSAGCHAEIVLSAAQANRLLRARDLQIHVQNQPGARTMFALAVSDWAAAIDGDATPSQVEGRLLDVGEPVVGNRPTTFTLVPAASQAIWTKVCGKDQSSGADVCYTTRDFVSAGAESKLALALAAYEWRRGSSQAYIVRALVPLEARLQSGITFRTDSGQSLDGQLTICFQNGCFAEAAASKIFIDDMKRANLLTVSVKNYFNRPIEFHVPLDKFGSAYDGQAIDPKVLEERRKLQADLAEKAREAQAKLTGEKAKR